MVARLGGDGLPGLERDVGRVADDHVDGAEEVVEGGGEVAVGQVDARAGEVALGPGQGTLVELDGKAGHTGAGKFRDMRRDNSATVDGLSTLRYGWSAVHDEPCVVAVEVAEVLINRGWRGLLERCGRCRLVHSV